MDSGDGWLDFRTRFIKMGIEPDEDIIEILECLSGTHEKIVRKEIQDNPTKIDKLVDDGIQYAYKIRDNIKVLSRRKNNRLRFNK